MSKSETGVNTITSVAWYDLMGKLKPIFPGDYKFPSQLPHDVLEECLKNVYPNSESPENQP